MSRRFDIVTVTLNPAVDHTVWIEGFRANAVNRVARDQRNPGGKGVNVAAVAAALGHRVGVTGFLGERGAQRFEHFFAERGIDESFVRLPGRTRSGIKIIDEAAGETTDINFPGVAPQPDDLRAIEDRVAALAVDTAWLVLAGSVPPGVPVDVYARLGERARAAGASVALDTSGPALAAGLACRPDLIKPNRSELEELTGLTLDDAAAVLDAAETLRASGLGTVVVSLGEDGALFVSESGAVLATPATVPVVSTVGAGDAMVAGTLSSVLRGRSLDATAAFATACSMAAIGTVGPALAARDVEQHVEKVEIESLRSRGIADGGRR